MKKKIFFFLVILIFLLGKPTVSQAKTTLFLTPESVTGNYGETFPLEIRLETTETVIGVDLNISFDPKLIEITQITPGGFFQSPQIITNLIDKEKGLVSFSLFSFQGGSGRENLITVFAQIIGKDFSSTAIKIEPETVLAGKVGKKIQVAYLGRTLISSSPLISTPTPKFVIEIKPSPTPTFGSQQPTISLEEEFPSSPAVKQPANFLTIMAVILLLLGLTALLVMKKNA